MRRTSSSVRDGAPLPAGTAAEVSKLAGVDAVTAVVPTEIYPLAAGLGDQSPWIAAGLSGTPTATTLDPDVVRGSLGDVHGDAVAVSRVFADGGDLRVGDTVPVRMADTTRATLRVAAIYDRAAGLGDVLLDPRVARRHAASPADTALFVAGGAAAGRSLSRYASGHPGVRPLNRGQYLAVAPGVERRRGMGRLAGRRPRHRVRRPRADQHGGDDHDRAP